MSNPLGAERDVWRRRVRAAFRDACDEMDRFFDVGHVELVPRDPGPEWDAIRSAPAHVRAALHGPAGCERLAPDVFVQQVSGRFSGGTTCVLAVDPTLDDVVDHVRGLLARRSLFSGASAVGAERNAVVKAALLLCGDQLEAARVEALFADDAETEVGLLHHPDAVEEESRRPRLANSDPRLVARARQVGEQVNDLERQLAAARADRDGLAVECRKHGWGYDRIAAALGVSKARARQLVDGVRTPVRATAAWSAADQF